MVQATNSATGALYKTASAADGSFTLASGLWEIGTGGSNDYLAGVGLPPEYLDIGSALRAPLPYRPWARDLRKAREAANDKDDPGGKCLPMSILQDHTHPFLRKVIQVPGLVVILNEKSNDFRQIFTDGRPLPVDRQPSFKGYSSGEWDGDTLIVQTIGFREDTWADVAGNPITEEDWKSNSPSTTQRHIAIRFSRCGS